MTRRNQTFTAPASLGSRVALAVVSAIVALFALVMPREVRAHGELLIQIGLVTRQIEATHDNPAPLFLKRGELHREHQDWEAAIADYARAADAAPDLVDVDFRRALLLLDLCELEGARALLDSVLAREPQHGQALIARARALAQSGRRNLAIADFRRGIELLVELDPEIFYELAEALDSEGHADEALRQLDEGIQRFGPTVSLQGYAVELELRRNNVDGAVARLDTLIARAVRKESWLARRGEMMLAAGRTAEARQSFEVALAEIDTLPSRLQTGAAMTDLRARVRAALATIAPPAPGSGATPLAHGS